VAGSNINRVTITGNLTRDPETRPAGGTTVTSLRVACNGRRKDQSGQWVDKPNYFDVTVWGAQGENCKRFLSRGRPVAVDGRLDWREWEDGNGNKRQAVDIVADTVQFLGSSDGGGGGGSYGGGGGQSFAPQQSDVRNDVSDFQPAEPAGITSNGHTTPADDDIPF
jgi:single-strand DNA-binding protein